LLQLQWYLACGESCPLYWHTVPNSLPERVPAYYSATVPKFLSENPAEILGTLTRLQPYDLKISQREAWIREIDILKIALQRLQGTVFLEFDVPRLGRRIDAVLVSGPAVITMEFKCGEHEYHAADYNQAWDYALDLKNFHLSSHNAPILPILIATDAPSTEAKWQGPDSDGVRPPRRCCADDLSAVLAQGLALVSGPCLDGEAWGGSPYQPTPTIIEAARALYSRHTVEAITRNDAGAKNLAVTSAAVEEIIERSRAKAEKAIVFVTGVPGAGKTLVGLNMATRRQNFGEARAVFLSGNGPLVAVLQEALTRDELARAGRRERKANARRKIAQFIQNVHHFRDEGIRRSAAPYDHVVIFDEAQRAWDKQKTADFMKRRKNVPNFNQSESEFLISYLNRHNDWAVIVCLVGGGQEIHTGEAGISAWLDAVRETFRHWVVYVSPDLTASEYAAGNALQGFRGDKRVIPDSRLHLSTSMRAFRSGKVSAFVKAVLDCDSNAARDLLSEISTNYPIAITRDLTRAKRWLHEHVRGSETYGLVASSGALRLKPHAVDVRVDVNPIHWFLNDTHDTRSSYYLEDVATEFQIQGLELDWIGVAWDGDLRFDGHDWKYHSFRRDMWTTIHKTDRRHYLLNAYRVLLTRARQGMVIFVPPGDASDATRAAEFYDQTYAYLSGIGIGQA
jgi:hypothetical protein